MCRQAGYYDHALFLASKHQLHEWYLKIQLDDKKDYQKALEYIGKLEFEEVHISSIPMADVKNDFSFIVHRYCGF